MSHHRLHTDASTSAINGTHPASEERPSLRPGRAQTARSWPLLVLALPATVAVWSGWVGIGQMTGFGQVYPLPGIFDSLHLDTAVTLPVGVEAYAAYALRAWLSASAAVSARTRRFARWSAIGSLDDRPEAHTRNDYARRFVLTVAALPRLPSGRRGR
jgi:hypothetical protein